MEIKEQCRRLPLGLYYPSDIQDWDHVPESEPNQLRYIRKDKNFSSELVVIKDHLIRFDSISITNIRNWQNRTDLSSWINELMQKTNKFRGFRPVRIQATARTDFSKGFAKNQARVEKSLFLVDKHEKPYLVEAAVGVRSDILQLVNQYGRLHQNTI